MIKEIRPAMQVDPDRGCLNLSDVTAQLTSEDPDWPIEQALLFDRAGGWRAAGPGTQTITLRWPGPISIRRIQLVFEELAHSRTQEFVIRASTGEGEREVV